MATKEPLVGGPDAADGDVENGAEKGSACSRRCCPTDLCCCVPDNARMFVPIPTTYTVMQDGTHGCLLAGFLGGVALVSEALGGMFENLECRPSVLPCSEEVLTVLSVLPCSFYICKLVSMYDSQLSEKEEEAKKHRQILEDSYSQLTDSMEKLLSKATQSSSIMAERNFDDHRRDFQHFLQKAETDLRVSSDVLLPQFRRFVEQWLRVFVSVQWTQSTSPERSSIATSLPNAKAFRRSVAWCGSG
jgi:hypothetical protein